VEGDEAGEVAACGLVGLLVGVFGWVGWVGVQEERQGDNERRKEGEGKTHTSPPVNINSPPNTSGPFFTSHSAAS